MRVQVICAHPLAESFTGAVHARVVGALGSAGHEVVATDLYREGFRPAMSGEERLAYYAAGRNTGEVQDYVDRLLWADALVFCFPVWWHDMPAMLKGYFDRVWVPGVAFELPDGGGPLRPGLTHVRGLGVVTSFGAPWWYVRLWMGDPVRRVFRRAIRPLLAKRARCLYLAHYGLDRPDEGREARFLEKVERAFARF
jgi:putative NADPH-quinone reductase